MGSCLAHILLVEALVVVSYGGVRPETFDELGAILILQELNMDIDWGNNLHEPNCFYIIA